jgi:hypothetical protein
MIPNGLIPGAEWLLVELRIHGISTAYVRDL